MNVKKYIKGVQLRFHHTSIVSCEAEYSQSQRSSILSVFKNLISQDMKMTSLATILMILPLVFCGTINEQKKSCQCRRSDAFYSSGKCLRSLPCKNYHALPSMLNDRKIGKKFVVYNRAVYRSYPVMARHLTRHCPVVGTSYNQKFGICTRKLKCFEKVFGVPNGSISKNYYILNNKFYQSYPSYCN